MLTSWSQNREIVLQLSAGCSVMINIIESRREKLKERVRGRYGFKKKGTKGYNIDGFEG